MTNHKLDKSNIEDIHSLTQTQLGILYHYLYRPISLSYHEQIIIRLNGCIDRQLMEQAITDVVEINPILRSVFRWKGLDTAYQVILKRKTPIIQWREIEESALDSALQLLYMQRIDIETAPLVFHFFHYADNQYIFVIRHHHILLDGWSNAIFLREILQYYEAAVKRELVPVPNKGSYKDYLIACQNTMNNQAAIEYWKRQLNGYSHFIQSHTEGDGFQLPLVEKIELHKDTQNKIQTFIQTNEMTLAGFFFTVWGLWLQMHYHRSDVVFGTVTSGRNIHVQGIENIVGMFSLTVPFRFQTGSKDRNQIILNVKKQLTERDAYVFVSPAELERFLNQKELFNTIVVIENYPIIRDKWSDKLEMAGIDVIESTHYDLTFAVDINESYFLRLIQNPEATEFDLKRIGYQIEQIIQTLLTKEILQICDTSVEPQAAEASPIITEVNETRMALPKEYQKPNNEIYGRLIDAVKRIIQPLEFNPTVSLFQNGIDSIKTMHINFAIYKTFGINLELKKLFEAENFFSLAVLIETQMNEQSQGMNQTAIPSKMTKTSAVPASRQQKRIYFACQLNPDSLIYHIPVILEMRGEISVNRLKNAIRDLVARHSILRTRFAFREDNLYQVMDENAANIYLITDTIGDTSSPQCFLPYIHPFHLESDVLFRCTLLKCETDHRLSWLLIDIHHILVDGTSLNILLRDFMDIYNGRKLSPVEFEYKDYVLKHENGMEQISEKQEKYWLSRFIDGFEMLRLPYDTVPDGRITQSNNHMSILLEKKVIDQLREMALAQNVTLQTLFFTAANFLFYQHCGQEQINLGVPVINRTNETQETVGLFVNLLIISNYVQAENTVGDLIHRVHINEIDALNNQQYPYELLIEKLHLEKIIGQNMAVKVMFLYQNIAFEQLQFSDLEVKRVEFHEIPSDFDLTVEIIESENTFRICFTYNCCLFQKEHMKNMITDYLRILTNMTEYSERKVGELMAVCSTEKKGEEKAALACFAYLQEQAHWMAVQYPHEVAVVWEHKEYTYQWLDEMSDRAAHFFMEKGCKKNEIIAILSDRSIVMMVLVLGIFKAGAICLPIDPRNTEIRIKEIMDDSGACFLLSCMPDSKIQTEIPCFSFSEKDLYNLPSSSLVMELNENAYCIYTSGSTGKPKGVILKHVGIQNHIRTKIIECSINRKDILCFNLNIGFVASIWQLFTVFYTGAKTVIYPSVVSDNLPVFFDRLERDNVTIVEIIPSLLSMYLQWNEGELENTHLRTILLTGEKVSPSQLKTINAALPRVQLINAYGQSECSDDTLHYHICPEDAQLERIPIGKPALNTLVYILDEQHQLLPDGEYGEICIAGMGVAAGYLNRPEETASKFIPHPDGTDKILYCTGDYGRALKNGEYEYLGRKDDQVKINGNRVELSEIEAQIERVDGIRKPCVLYDAASSCLIVFYTGEIGPDRLRQTLQKLLPTYMIPSLSYQIDSFPLTLNGKIDRQALINRTHVDLEPLTSQEGLSRQEQAIWTIWKELIPDLPPNAKTNFFESGGNSIKAMMLAARLSKMFSVPVDFKTIFENPTIGRLAAWINRTETKNSMQQIVRVPKKMFYSLSKQQEKIYWASIKEQDSLPYHNTLFFQLTGILDRDRLERSLKKLIAYHDALRMTFHLLDDTVVQQLHEEGTLEFIYQQAHNRNSRDIIRERKPFDLKKGPLFRFQCYEVEVNRYTCILDMHHIISDGTSIQILLRDLLLLYQNSPELQLRSEDKIDYSDYLDWLSQYIKSEQYQKNKRYWLNEYAQGLPQFQLPHDYYNQDGASATGQAVQLNIMSDAMRQVKKYAFQHNITLFDFFYAVFRMTLIQYTGAQEDVVLTTVSGREMQELENVVGLFVNNLPIRFSLQAEASLRDLIFNLKNKTLEAFSHMNFHFDDLFETGRFGEQSSQVMFVFQNYSQTKLNIPGIEIKRIPFEKEHAQMDMVWELYETADGMHIELEYMDQRYAKESMQNLLHYYCVLMNQILKDDSIGLKDVTLPENPKTNGIRPLKEDFSAWKPIHQFFEERAKSAPDAVAVSYRNEILTYGELNRYADQLAFLFQEEGVKEKDIVCLALSASNTMLAAALGILKLGAICLPLAADSPQIWVQTIMADSNAVLLLDDVKLKSMWDSLCPDSPRASRTEVSAESPAYVIYTSGSTGRPKGVLLSHKGIVNHILTKLDVIGISEKDKMCFSLKTGFVASIWQLFVSAFRGIELRIYPDSQIFDIFKMMQDADQDGVTIIETVPSVVRALVDQKDKQCSYSSIKKMILTGERVSTELVNRFYALYDIQLINAYGQSECSDDTLHYLIEQKEWFQNIPLGTPSHHTKVYILDPQMLPVLPGAHGEIYIESEGLAIGYLNRPEETAAAFIQNPSSFDKRLYKTGDIGRIGPDGNIEYVGRKDRQVKIMGNRVELDFIEEMLERVENVRSAAVFYDAESNAVVAYVVSSISSIQIKTALLKSMPRYMIPEFLYFVDHIPITTNGKKNYMELHSLHPYEQGAAINGVLEQATDLEEKLIYIWKMVFQNESIQSTDGFFTLGGDSLKAIRLLQLIYQQFHVNLTYADILDCVTIRDLAKRIKKESDLHSNGLYEELQKDCEIEHPASHVQRDMFVQQLLHPQSTAYNMTMAVKIQKITEEKGNEDITPI